MVAQDIKKWELGVWKWEREVEMMVLNDIIKASNPFLIGKQFSFVEWIANQKRIAILFNFYNGLVKGEL
ncbi:hypothetical protein OCK74_21670 [Chitinophagaceae bacterium LB-8]|uniref:Uncharacterized protein n=1 Tax=Paraflavisolibacter caeni TaxID=2982496 RepID=A0A9X2XYX0_9BACT|nr:hypothetical protein [Paraflavisolibacter caeni]MCU7551745.1 hypothetical protein [Paraflavisolibacter caeni]